MDEAAASQNSDERGRRLSKCRDGYYAFIIRSCAPALFLIFSSFIRHSYLTWQDDPCTTATITIHGVQTPRELTLYCNGVATTVAGFEMPIPDRRRIYHFHLKNLEPDTDYTVEVEDSSYVFKTLALQPPYRFIEGGDWENTQEAAELAKLAASKKPDAVLLGGDYPSNVVSSRDYRKWDHWLDVYTKNFAMTPLVMAIGNHEVVGGYNQPKSQAPFFFHYFRTKENPESYYTIPLGEAFQIYILDSGHVTTHEEQTAWLEENFANQRFKLALYHVPLFPSVRFAEKGLAYKFTLKGMQLLNRSGKIYSQSSNKGRQYWLPLFKKHHLNIAFEHHDQALKRTREMDGTVYLGDGGFGPIQQHLPIQGYFNPHFATLKGKEHFFWMVDIDEEIEVRAISKENESIDFCQIRRSNL